MWEAMGKPLLPTFARAFAGQLRDEIEKSIAGAEPMPAPPPDRVTGIAALKRWLGKLWHAVTGRGRFNT
jgi:hypothetical protein